MSRIQGIELGLDPMALMQLALKEVSEIHVKLGDDGPEVVVTRTSTFAGHQEVLDALRVYYFQLMSVGPVDLRTKRKGEN